MYIKQTKTINEQTKTISKQTKTLRVSVNHEPRINLLKEG